MTDYMTDPHRHDGRHDSLDAQVAKHNEPFIQHQPLERYLPQLVVVATNLLVSSQLLMQLHCHTRPRRRSADCSAMWHVGPVGNWANTLPFLYVLKGPSEGLFHVPSEEISLFAQQTVMQTLSVFCFFCPKEEILMASGWCRL